MTKVPNCKVRRWRHVFVDGVCKTCGVPQGNPKTFARLAYIAEWRRDMSRLWRSIAVEMVRPIAREILQNALDGGADLPPWSIFDDERYDRLFELALVDYKLQHPTARGERLWIFTAPDGKGRASVACRFCGRILVPSARLGSRYDSETHDHVAWCALSALATAGSAKPVTRKPVNTEGVQS